MGWKAEGPTGRVCWGCYATCSGLLSMLNFGDDAIPRGTWQIDPFGHSNTQAWLLGAESGFESLFWGRTDYQDFEARKNKSRTEWIWEGSQSLGKSANLFAGELYGGGNGGYGTWIGYDGDQNQVQDDPQRVSIGLVNPHGILNASRNLDSKFESGLDFFYMCFEDFR